jgi:hypothetical protein
MAALISVRKPSYADELITVIGLADVPAGTV